VSDNGTEIVREFGGINFFSARLALKMAARKLSFLNSTGRKYSCFKYYLFCKKHYERKSIDETLRNFVELGG